MKSCLRQVCQLMTRSKWPAAFATRAAIDATADADDASATLRQLPVDLLSARVYKDMHMQPKCVLTIHWKIQNKNFLR